MKSKMYVASYAVTTKRKTGSFEYIVFTKKPDGEGFDEAICATEEEAKQLVADPEALISVRRDQMKTEVQVGTAYEPFESESAAEAWVQSRREHFESRPEVTNVTTLVREVMIDTDELIEYAPVYEVELEVVITKRMYVTVDSSEYDDINDEYDAREWAADMVRGGEMDSELEYADTGEIEVDHVGCEEQ